MDWKQQAKILFNVPKPEHFVKQHCCECAEHDETLATFDVDSIGLDQLGNPGWDPMCFSSVGGVIYYMPALIRLTVDTIDKPNEVYLDQLLFHLVRDGAANDLVNACNTEQRRFIADFLEYLIEHHSNQIDGMAFTADDILKAHAIWSG
jgi:hypothetical protein